MIQKKSVYVIDAITDETTSLVRKGSMVRLSSGVGEFILLSDWSSGAFSAQSYYDINMNSGGFKFKKDLPENGAGFDLTLTDYLSFPNLSMLIDLNVYDNESDESSRCLAMVGEGQDDVILIGNGTTSISYNDGVVKIGNDAQSNFILNGTIHFNKSSDKTYPSNSITIGEIYATIPSASVGMNNNITLNAANIVTNAANIALVKQSQTEYTTLKVYSDNLSEETDSPVTYLRVGRSTNITHVSCETADISFSPLYGAIGLEFDFNVSAVLNSELLNIGRGSSDGEFFNGTIVSTTPLKIVTSTDIISSAVQKLTLDFSILGTW